ncbi:3-hydroxyacyl-CoA dehydrogenase [Rhodococcus sp. PAM 2766]|uniref:3-hydroxyacyl-CoA dehydrogenase n=1 Tax=Rhodococcus parequi TaxID=3137122 RepID=A0ABW9FEY0_9NOCA
MMGTTRIRVIGAGAMGRGIAQIAVLAGFSVELTDVSDDAVAAGLDFVGAMVRRSVEKGQRTVEEAERALALLHRGASPTAPAADVDLAIEAVVENLAVKQALFTELETALPNAVLASNTSSLPITTIASALHDPSRLLGLHFFNPVPLMKLVEVIPGLRTDPDAVATALRFVEAVGHRPVVATDTPGFLVNHIGRALPTEALALLSEGIASEADIDRIVRDTVGLKMGPFELMDLTGLDVSHAVMEIVSAGFYGEPRLRPSALAAVRVTAGLLGRKTGAGFYRSSDGQQQAPPELGVEPDPVATRIYVHHHPDFAAVLRAAGAAVVDAPAADAVAVVLPVGEPTYRAAGRAGLDASRTVGIDPLSLAGPRLTVTVPALLDPGAGRAALRVLAATGRAVTATADGPAAVAQRILACIVNLACALAEQGIGRPDDIDLAARTGLGYPLGPLELGDKYGPALVLRILDELLSYTGDPRYRASRWLRERAEQGMSLRDIGTRPERLFD